MADIPTHAAAAQAMFLAWYASITRPAQHVLPDGQVATSSEVESAIVWMIRAGGDTLAYAGTQAWLSGFLPGQFNDRLSDWLARAAEGKRRYQRRKELRGVAFANTAPHDPDLWDPRKPVVEWVDARLR